MCNQIISMLFHFFQSDFQQEPVIVRVLLRDGFMRGTFRSMYKINDFNVIQIVFLSE